MDAASLKEDGNACMAEADYVGAMKFYSQAITLSPKDAALYSNRSFSFLKLGLSARALADADECVKYRRDWPKGHFRRAEALTQAGLHADALVAYNTGFALDPTDDHLKRQCVEAQKRDQDASRYERVQIAFGSGLLAVIVVLLLASSASPPGALVCVTGLLGAALVGGVGGFGYVMLRRQQKAGAVLPPLQSNEMFAALNMKGDRTGAGELRSAVLEQQQQPPQRPVACESGDAVGDASTPSGSGGSASSSTKRRVKKVENGRAAALKALGKQRS